MTAFDSFVNQARLIIIMMTLCQMISEYDHSGVRGQRKYCSDNDLLMKIQTIFTITKFRELRELIFAACFLLVAKVLSVLLLAHSDTHKIKEAYNWERERG